MKITFHGAARSVTGTRHLIEVNDKRVLLDCGLVQGRRAEADERNRRMGFDAGSVDAVVLSHAHIDHSGAIPALVKNGFRGPVHATPATADLCTIMLADSAHLQEQDAIMVNKREGLTGHRAKQPLYTQEDADRAIKRFRSEPYRKPFHVVDGVTATFLDAGHILGAAMVRLDLEERGRRVRVLFSGDLGRPSMPIVTKPEPAGAADVLILETTYGNREHAPFVDVQRELEALVNRVIKRGGKIIIPAFAVGRTQQITFMLNTLANEGRIPKVPVFVDSPLASEATEVFRRHPDCWAPDMVRLLRAQNDADPFGFRMLTYVPSAEESKKLNSLEGPAVIISASGMCESGRILHHLAHHLPDPRNLVMIVGYMAEGTLGRKLVDGAPLVRIYGRDVERRAEVIKLNALSAHAGRADLEGFVRSFNNGLRKIFLVHGEPAQSEAFATWARQNTSAAVDVPAHGQSVDL